MSDTNLVETAEDVIPLRWRQRAYVALGLVSAILTAVGAGYAAVDRSVPDVLVAALAVVVSLMGPASLMSRVYARTATVVAAESPENDEEDADAVPLPDGGYEPEPDHGDEAETAVSTPTTEG